MKAYFKSYLLLLMGCFTSSMGFGQSTMTEYFQKDLDGKEVYLESFQEGYLSRHGVMLASNLIIDPEGKIQFMSLLDSKSFGAKLVDLRQRLDELLQNP